MGTLGWCQMSIGGLLFSRTFCHFSPLQASRSLLCSNFEPHILATSSVDSYVHVWDIRDGRKPSYSFCAWTGNNCLSSSFLSFLFLSFLQFATSGSGCLSGEMEQIEPEHYCFFSRQCPSDLGQKGLAPLFLSVSFFSPKSKMKQKGSVPLALITAHMSKIYGIDWSHHQENAILTCGQDKQVKASAHFLFSRNV